VTEKLLKREGWEVLLAKDGIDALEQLQANKPSVMLVDIEMPRMDGFDLTRNIRADDKLKAIPIIMITSRIADKHRDHAFSLGVNAYMGKPYRDDELLAEMIKLTTVSTAPSLVV
jgi:chemosensory pili system protein ChpA (sensor histidine kinase/response regulator)